MFPGTTQTNDFFFSRNAAWRTLLEAWRCVALPCPRLNPVCRLSESLEGNISSQESLENDPWKSARLEASEAFTLTANPIPWGIQERFTASTQLGRGVVFWCVETHHSWFRGSCFDSFFVAPAGTHRLSKRFNFAERSKVSNSSEQSPILLKSPILLRSNSREPN